MIQRSLWERGRDAFDLFVAPSHRVRIRLEEAGFGPVVVVPNAVPRVGAGPTGPSVAEPGDSGRFTIGFAGRWAPEKGIGTLIEAFARVAREEPRAKLVLLGDGEARAAIEGRVAALGLEERIELTGWLPRAEVERRLRDVAVQAVPSLWEEPFGLVAAEALMRGTPVVASDAGGLSEVVEHERTGLTVPPGDVDALAEALLRVLRDRGNAARLAREGHRIAGERHSEDLWLDRMIAIYERLAAA
jgi:glycosyltransferase involved in cell wall biosynthesis